MVAYSFKRQFAEPILAGTKRQTIRRPRKRHVRPGERMQLFTGMRTKHCRRITEVECTAVRDIEITMTPLGIETVVIDGNQVSDLEAFARQDGFASLEAMSRFWRENHGAEDFRGYLIEWKQNEGGKS